MSKHYMVKCNLCDKVISQCRCMAENKEVKYEICDECKDKLGKSSKELD